MDGLIGLQPAADDAIATTLRRCDLAIAAWGAMSPWMRPRADEVGYMLASRPIPVGCLGWTRDDSDPRHPLMVRRTAVPTDYICRHNPGLVTPMVQLMHKPPHRARFRRSG